MEVFRIEANNYYEAESDSLMNDEEDQIEFFGLLDTIPSLDERSYIPMFCFGIFTGLCLILFSGFYLKGSILVRHDWPSLYGGFIMGILLNPKSYSRR